MKTSIETWWIESGVHSAKLVSSTFLCDSLNTTNMSKSWFLFNIFWKPMTSTVIKSAKFKHSGCTSFTKISLFGQLCKIFCFTFEVSTVKRTLTFLVYICSPGDTPHTAITISLLQHIHVGRFIADTKGVSASVTWIYLWVNKQTIFVLLGCSNTTFLSELRVYILIRHVVLQILSHWLCLLSFLGRWICEQ